MPRARMRLKKDMILRQVDVNGEPYVHRSDLIEYILAVAAGLSESEARDILLAMPAELSAMKRLA